MGGGHPFDVSRYLFLDTFSMNSIMIKFDAKLRFSILIRDFAYWIVFGNQTMNCQSVCIQMVSGDILTG